MKTTNLIIAACVLIGVATTSCVEKSDKYKNVVAQRDSIYQSEQMLKAEFDQTLEVLNEIESSFQTLREVENQVVVQMNTPEGRTLSKRQMIADQVNQIKDILEENKKKIDDLEQKMAQSNKKNSSLSKTITRLQNELSEKLVIIQTLQADIEAKNGKIRELTAAVDCLSNNNKELQDIATSQQAALEEQDKEFHKVWFVVGDSKKLQALDILRNNGVLKSKTLKIESLNPNNFNVGDMRELRVLETNSKKPVLISTHPTTSYKFAKRDDKCVNIIITDPAKFWSLTKYLVVRE